MIQCRGGKDLGGARMKSENSNLDFTNDNDVGELSRIKALLAYHLEQDSDSQTLGRLFLDLGKIYLRIRNYPLAHQAWEKASQCFKNTKNGMHLAETYYQHGLLLAQEKKYIQALEKWSHALHSLSSAYREEIVLKCKIFYEMGQSLLILGELDHAEESFEQELELSLQIQRPDQEALACQGLGQYYTHLQYFSKAQEFYIQSLRIWEEIGIECRIHSVLKELGHVYQRQGDNNKAIHVLKSSLKTCQQVEERVDIHLLLAWLYLKVDLEQAKTYCKKIIDLLLISLVYRFNPIQEKQLARVLYILGLYYRERQERKNLLVFCKQSMQIYQKYRMEEEWNHVFQLYNKFAPAEERGKFFKTRELVNTLPSHEKLHVHNFIG